MPATSPQPDIRLVVFDLGRVLLRIAEDWEHVATRAGITLPAALAGDISSAGQRDQDPALEAAFADFETGRLDADAFFGTCSPLLGLSSQQAIDLFDAWLIEPMPGIVPLLDAIQQRGVPTACLSNTNPQHWVSLTNPDHPACLPLDRLTHVFPSQDVGHAKPNAEAYEHVERETDTGAAHILFFDDLEENVAAAQQRGWYAELIPRLEDPVPLLRQHLTRYGVLP